MKLGVLQRNVHLALRNSYFQFGMAVVLSLGAHALLGSGTLLLPEVGTQKSKVMSITVSTLPKVPTPAPTAAPTPVPTQPPVVEEKVVVEKKKPNKPRVDKTVPKSNEPPPPEVAGVSQSSTALPGTGTGPGVAIGNSATAEVIPEQANAPPPKPYNPVVDDPDANPVAETVADEEAKCPYPVGLQNTEDAINAGVISAKIELSVFVNSKGEVSEVIFRKKTGFEIDAIVLKEVKKIKCVPAKVAGKAVAVKQKILKFEIRE
jgi:hypothetical protein